jgi:hypothetical protein
VHYVPMFRGICYLHIYGLNDEMFLRNIVIYPPDFMVSNPRILLHSDGRRTLKLIHSLLVFQRSATAAG